MALSTLPSRLLAPLSAPLRHLFSEHCVLCGATATAPWCQDCGRELPGTLAPRCPVCAQEMPCAPEVCGHCLRRPPAFAQVTAAAGYAFPLDAVIQRLKYAADLSLARPLAALLAMRVRSAPRPEVVVGMPLSAQRLRERGFNQANEIGRLVAQEVALPFLPDACHRVRHAAPQVSLPLAQRARNVKGAFAVQADLSGRVVAVVDDVLTTGASLGELALTLKQAGARAVVGWVVARTPPPR